VEWLEGLDKASVWQASRLVTTPATDAGKAKILMLQVKDPTTKHVTREAVDNRSKGQLFYETFFPPPNSDLAPVLQDYQYPPPCWNFKNVTDEQVHHAIKKMKPYKASKKGSIPNSVLIHAREELVPFLSPLFCATDTLKYYPQEWACTETLILKKPGKPDYTSPSAWCLIILSDGMARLLNSCQAEDMTMMCEKYNILPTNHFGARPGHTTTDSIHLLTKTIKDVWQKGQVASVLFLDVKGAFPSVDIDQLIHNMKKQGIPKEYMEWMKRCLENRRTTISFNEYQIEAFKVLNGLDQGDPYSGVSYLIYNADILKIPVLKAGEWILLFVDDAVIIVCGKNFNETHEKLCNIMNHTGGVFKWAKTHNCEFGIEKFQLLDAMKKQTPNPINSKERIPIP
jgi:Reverse transcriptase (RNA-dependent DNA polymerase)